MGALLGKQAGAKTRAGATPARLFRIRKISRSATLLFIAAVIGSQGPRDAYGAPAQTEHAGQTKYSAGKPAVVTAAANIPAPYSRAKAVVPKETAQAPSAGIISGADKPGINATRGTDKKSLYIAAKSVSVPEVGPDLVQPLRDTKSMQKLARRRALSAERVINIYNKWTNEFVVVDAQTADALEVDANAFFRCHFTGEPTEIDPLLVKNLVKAARHFKVDRVNVVSGFRAPKYNLILRKKGRQVARESQHTQGNAIDFRLPGVPVRKLYRWAKRQRLGGVGFYAKSGFVHMDTGPVRTWNGR